MLEAQASLAALKEEHEKMVETNKREQERTATQQAESGQIIEELSKEVMLIIKLQLYQSWFNNLV